MSFIRLCTLVLVASSSLAACSSYDQAKPNKQISVLQVKDGSAFINSLKPSSSNATIGKVISIAIQDREQQKVSILAQNGQSYTVSINKSNLGRQNASHMQKLAMGDYVELVGKPSDSNNQITVTAIPYVIRKIAVADHKADCIGVVPQSCLLTKPADQASSQRDWEYRYNGIEGFNYEPNYEYTLLIKNTPVINSPADGSSVRSELIEILEKKSTKA